MYSEAEVAQLAEQRARDLAAVQQFDVRANQSYNEGKQLYGDFDNALTDLRANFGPQDKDFVEAVLDTGAGAQVLYEMGKKPEVAARLLGMQGRQRDMALAQLAYELRQRPRAPTTTGAPPPINPSVTGAGGQPFNGTPDPSMPLERWIELRNKQAAGTATGRR
jgi:hypothetical protein